MSLCPNSSGTASGRMFSRSEILHSKGRNCISLTLVVEKDGIHGTIIHFFHSD